MNTTARCFVLATAIVSGTTSGCRDPQEYEIVYRTDVTLGDASQPLPPTGLNLAYDDRLMQGRAADPDLSHLQPKTTRAAEGAAGGVPPEIVDLVKQFSGLIQAGEYDQVPDLFIDDLREVVQAQFQQLKLIKEYQRRTGDRNTAMMFEMGLKQAANIQVVSATQRDDGTLVVQVGVGGAAQPQEFKQVDGKWLFGSGGTFAGRTEDALKLSRQFNETLQGILDGLDDGSVDAQAAAQQFQAALADLMKAAAAAPGAAPTAAAAGQDHQQPQDDAQDAEPQDDTEDDGTEPPSQPDEDQELDDDAEPQDDTEDDPEADGQGDGF